MYLSQLNHEPTIPSKALPAIGRLWPSQLKVVPKLFKFVPKLFQGCLIAVQRLYQNCLKVLAKLSKTLFQWSRNCLKFFAKLSNSCPKVVTKLFQSFLKVVSKLSQSCPKVIQILSSFSFFLLFLHGPNIFHLRQGGVITPRRCINVKISSRHPPNLIPTIDISHFA